MPHPEESMMRALRLNAYGGPEVMSLDEVPVPMAGRGDVLVRVAAASINPFDWKLRAGMLRNFFPLTLPLSVGRDFAGVVTAVGADVADLAVGAAVAGTTQIERGGSHAEYTLAARTSIVPVAAGLDPVLAAAAGVVGLSAYIPLVEAAQVARGERVLILGGSGGVGAMAVQIAAGRGAEPWVTTRARHAAALRALGAAGVIDRERDDLAAQAGRFDVLFDTVGGAFQARMLPCLKPGGRVVALTAAPVDSTQRRSDVSYLPVTIRPDGGRLAAVMAMVAAGTARPVVAAVLPLVRWAEAYAQVERGDTAGKIVLAM
jgi:NADPH:quinone reductase-like Zn-dependent oxidoreductase